jgi:hypothetical protein
VAATGDSTIAVQNGPKKKFLASLRMENYGGFTFYFWHGMCAGGWFRLLKRNRFRISPACVPQVVSVSLLAPLQSLLRRVSEARYRRQVEKYEIDQPPVFIIGHWRTGTTYLHDLLSCDPAFGYPTTYECFMPNHFLLTESVARLGFGLFLPKTRPQDNVAVGVDKPQEDEFALCNMGLPSPLLTFALARGGPADMAYLDLREVGETERRQWKEGFLWFIRRVAFRQNKRLILKSPTHTARLRTLIELFPDARFIYLARNPLSVFPSTMHLWKAMNSTQGLQNPAYDDPWLEDFVLDTFMHMYRRYEEDRDLIPSGQLAEIRYEDLVADPKGVLRGLYKQLDLGDFARAENGVDAHLDRTRDYRTNEYALTQEQQRRVQERWGDYFESFGYDRPRAAA